MKIFFTLFKNRLSGGFGKGIFQGNNPFGGKFMRVEGVTGVLSEGLKLSTRVREKLR